jgi:hypothetical protein
MHRSLRGILVFALIAGSAASAAAQTTGTPIYKAPYRVFENSEFGASLSDPGEGVDFAFEGFYRFAQARNDFGLRAGIADAAGDDSIFLLGGDFRTQVVTYSESFPLDGAITLGLGGAFGEGDDVFLLPVGISLGRRFDVEGSSTTFTPYLHPNVVPIFGGEDDGVDFTLGLGVDIRFGDRWSARASGGLGDIEGVGISVAYLR